MTNISAAPENVPAPQGESGPRHIFVTWDPPAAPNGNLTGYFLYMDETLVYTGAGTAFNVTNELRVSIYIDYQKQLCDTFLILYSAKYC